MSAQPKIDYGAMNDLELAGLIAARDAEAVRLVTSRNNQRLFRTAWSVLKDRSDAEDCVQSAVSEGVRRDRPLRRAGGAIRLAHADRSQRSAASKA
ncbi:MAG TPA: hypothetical protein VGB70_07940 [Allosphingosinicella sp.]